MSRCPDCAADVAGLWYRCPLCRAPLEGERDVEARETYPAAPLRFSRKVLGRVMLLLSLLAIVGSFSVQALMPNLVAPVRTIWLSVAVLWLVALAVVQRRRNVGGLVAWLLVLLSLAVWVWNLFVGPEQWATTWAIPAICLAANVTLGVVVWIIRQDPSEHLAKAVLVGLIGMVPGLFVVFGWVTTAVPALICVGVSAVLLVSMFTFRPRQLTSALSRRLHV